MSGHSPPERERLLELLAGAALGDLSLDEQGELRALSERFPDVAPEEFELVAAAVDVSLQSADLEPLPVMLHERIAASARRQAPAAPRSAADAQVSQSSPSANRREALAWLSAAACLVIALFGWFGRGPEQTAVAPELRRASLLSGAEDLLTLPWQPGKHPFAAPVEGDVVWSNARQEGYLRFLNMPANDPRIAQYQLWIIDPARDDEPIDGGVFDIGSSGEVVVAIRAKLAVIAPAAFAITIEKPGGVVVSTQDRLPLIASVK